MPAFYQARTQGSHASVWLASSARAASAAYVGF